jgi:glycosyltransferase involved in cell wall biosynthesis
MRVDPPSATDAALASGAAAPPGLAPGDGIVGDADLVESRYGRAGVSAGPLADARVALVHDWLPVYGGAERVLGEMIGLIPDADLFSLIDFVPDGDRAFLAGKDVKTSFIQRLPWARRAYRHYLPLAPLAIESFDLRAYDVVVSSSYVVAKGVLTSPDQLHVSYVHSPIRYAWDLQATYLEQAGMVRGVRSSAARLILHYLRMFDAVSASRVDHYVANSHHVARRIRKTYRRDCDVVYPPVDTDAFTPQDKKDSFYITTSRLVPYKRVDLIARAFAAMPDKELIIIGDGPEMKRVRAAAGPNVTVLGQQPFDVVRHYLQHARGFVFAAEEDFGIAPVEAQACGTPVVALGRGGATETVVDGETGVFFREQSVEALCAAIDRFERIRDRLDPERVRQQAELFSRDRFRESFAAVLDREQRRHSSGGLHVAP